LPEQVSCSHFHGKERCPELFLDSHRKFSTRTLGRSRAAYQRVGSDRPHARKRAQGPAAHPAPRYAAIGRWVCDSDRRPVREAGQDPVELAVRLLEAITWRPPGSRT